MCWEDITQSTQPSGYMVTDYGLGTGSMSHQLGLPKNFFIKLVDCVMSCYIHHLEKAYSRHRKNKDRASV